jgi:hypothetical protein
MRDFTTNRIANHLNEEIEKSKFEDFGNDAEPLIQTFISNVDKLAASKGIKTKYFIDILGTIESTSSLSSSFIGTDLGPYNYTILEELLNVFRQLQIESQKNGVEEFINALPSKKELLLLTKKLRSVAEHLSDLAELAKLAEEKQYNKKG